MSNVNAHLKEEEEAGNGDDYEGNDDDDASGTKRQQQDLRRRRFPGVAAADLVTFDLHWAPDALALAKQHVTIVPPCYIEYSTPLQSDASLEDFSTEEFGAPSVRVRQPGLEPLEKRRHPISSTSSAHLPRRLRGPARQRHRGAPELGRPAQPQEVSERRRWLVAPTGQGSPGQARR